MDFKKEKKEFLKKKDKSRKRSIDIKIKKLVNKINSLDDFFTTSSCSGRILLFTLPELNKKNKVKYLFCSHRKVKFTEIQEITDKKLPKNDVWLKVQPVILHIACKNIDHAKEFLNTARDIGFRRSGIISITRNKIFLELISTENIEAIISKNGKLVIKENYFKILIKEGNKKLEKTWEKIDKLHSKLTNVIVGQKRKF